MWLFSIGNGPEIWPLEKGRKCPEKNLKNVFHEGFFPYFFLNLI